MCRHDKGKGLEIGDDPRLSGLAHVITVVLISERGRQEGGSQRRRCEGGSRGQRKQQTMLHRWPGRCRKGSQAKVGNLKLLKWE